MKDNIKAILDSGSEKYRLYEKGDNCSYQSQYYNDIEKNVMNLREVIFNLTADLISVSNHPSFNEYVKTDVPKILKGFIADQGKVRGIKSFQIYKELNELKTELESGISNRSDEEVESFVLQSEKWLNDLVKTCKTNRTKATAFLEILSKKE